MTYQRPRPNGNFRAEVQLVLSKLPIGCTKVHASTQYGMGFILSEDNQILLRDDRLCHTDRELIADAVNRTIRTP